VVESVYSAVRTDTNIKQIAFNLSYNVMSAVLSEDRMNIKATSVQTALKTQHRAELQHFKFHGETPDEIAKPRSPSRPIMYEWINGWAVWK
jgi:hypothetical protein